MLKKYNFYDNFWWIYPFINLFLNGHKKLLIKEINQLKSGDLLEVGVGTGKHLTKYKNHQITAIDNHPKMITLAQKNKTKNIAYKLMDGENTSFKNEHFDYIVLAHILSVVQQPENLIEECTRLLKKGGKILILNHFTPQNPLILVDLLFQPFSKFFQFQSYFPLGKFNSKPNLKVVKHHKIGILKYYQLLILEKK